MVVGALVHDHRGIVSQLAGGLRACFLIVASCGQPVTVGHGTGHFALLAGQQSVETIALAAHKAKSNDDGEELKGFEAYFYHFNKL